jgi:hypothetical protein
LFFSLMNIKGYSGDEEGIGQASLSTTGTA